MKPPRVTTRTPRRLAVVAAVLLAATVGATRAEAATPDSATVSPTSTDKSWNGGPFLVPNPTSSTGGLACNPVTVCDDSTLTVDVPAGYDRDNYLRIAVGWPATTADFDVYLYDSAGHEIAQTTSTVDPEVLYAPPIAGRYTVRVVPFNPLGQSYWALASLVSKSATPMYGTMGGISLP